MWNKIKKWLVPAGGAIVAVFAGLFLGRGLRKSKQKRIDKHRRAVGEGIDTGRKQSDRAGEQLDASAKYAKESRELSKGISGHISNAREILREAKQKSKSRDKPRD